MAFFKWFTYFCMWGDMGVRGQLAESVLSSTTGIPRISSGHQAWWQASSLTRPSCEPPVFLYLLSKRFVLCVWVFWLRVCLCTVYMSGAHRGQERVLDALRLELQVMSHHVGAANQTQEASCGRASSHWGISLQPLLVTVCVPGCFRTLASASWMLGW